MPRPGNAFAESAIGLPLSSLLWEAMDMHFATEVLIGVLKAKFEDDFSALRARSSIKGERDEDKRRAVEVAQLMLLGMCATHLEGVRLVPDIDIESDPGTERLSRFTLRPGYACDCLLSAMWLQLYVAVTENRLLRAGCPNCGRSFEATDRRQRYCNEYCRRAFNQRNYYKRTKGRKHV